MAESAFSTNGKYYAAISEDGRLRIWDTEENVLKQEYTPDLHLTSPLSCLHWLNVQTVVKKQRKSDAGTENETQCVALGTFSGKILIYSVTQGKIEAVFEKGQTSKITALDWHKEYGLYSCTKDFFVSEWNLQDGSVRNKYKITVDSKGKQGNHVSAIKIVPHKLSIKAHYLIAASWQIKLWRLERGNTTVVKSLGHSASQTALLSLACVNDVCWLVEGSQSERLLSFWDVTITSDYQPQVNGDTEPTKKKRRKSITVPVATPSYTFVLEDAARMVDVELKEEDGAVRLSLAAATRSGVVHYYRHALNGSSVKPFKPTVTVQTTTPEAVPLPLQCCRLKQNGDLLLGYQREPVLLFESVTPDLNSKTQVLIRGENKQTKKIKQVNETNKVRTDTNMSQVQVLEPLGGVVSRKRTMPGAQVEVPMEARLANLSLDIKSRSKYAVNQNLTKLLIQGLHSKDKDIIRTVLYKNDSAAALRTVSNLPAEYVPSLLVELSDMASSSTTLCASVCTWLNALLRCHSALLLAVINSQRTEQLTQLLAIFTHRRSHLCQLLNLKGRLDLTIKQRTAAAEAQENQNAVLDYNDTSSDEETEVKDQVHKSDSEESWDDNKFEDSEQSGDEGGGDEQDDNDDDNDDEMDDDGDEESEDED